jgi:hypothetical protein
MAAASAPHVRHRNGDLERSGLVHTVLNSIKQCKQHCYSTLTCFARDMTRYYHLSEPFNQGWRGQMCYSTHEIPGKQYSTVRHCSSSSSRIIVPICLSPPKTYVLDTSQTIPAPPPLRARGRRPTWIAPLDRKGCLLASPRRLVRSAPLAFSDTLLGSTGSETNLVASYPAFSFCSPFLLPCCINFFSMLITQDSTRFTLFFLNE